VKRLRNKISTVGGISIFVFSLGLQLASGTIVYANDDLSTTITSSPRAVTSNQTATFEFSTPFDEGPVTFSCWLDGGEAVPCTSPFTTSILAEGSHTFAVAAQDSFSNFGPVDNFAWTISLLDSGDGSEGSPYQVSSCEDIQVVRDELGASYQLEGNIDCDGLTVEPIGSSGTPFTGTFNGNGYTISNITYVVLDDNVGLFGYTSEATITNLYLDNIVIGGNESVGALAGFTNYTTISYVGLRNADITGTGDNVGGLVGYLGGSTIEKSFAEDTIINGSNLVGGLSGIAIGPSTVSQSYFQGTVDGSTNVGGITGQVGAGPAYVTETYAEVTFSNAGSDVVGTIGSGAGETRNFIASAPYLENNTQAPLGTWDFTETWYIRTNDYPGLKPLQLPQLLCEAPQSTDTTASVTCTANPALQDPTSWELAYGYSDDTSWTTLPSESGDGFTATVNDLLPGTSYRIRFRYINDIGTSPWGSQEVITTGSSDIDGDGISNKEEFLGPNSGDADNDGTLDYTQANVTSFKGLSSDNYVVLKTSCNDNFNVQIGRESAEAADSNFDYPAGLVAFVARGCNVGGAANFTLFFYNQESTGLVLRKWNDGVYTAVPGAIIQQVTIGGISVTRASYEITDGSSLDDDGVADGNIVDPVGIAQSIVGSPNTGLKRN
jgi:hypothetical protein